MSLVEATVVMMVLAVLSAAAAPMIGSYITDAQASKARTDVEVIGAAIGQLLKDMGETWIMRNGNTSTTGAPSHADTNRVDLLVSDGETPVVGVARADGLGPPDWDATVDHAEIQLLAHHLVANTPSNASGNAYRTAPNMGTTANFDPDGGASFNGEFGWRGSYLAGEAGPDPWGNRYAVNVEFLAKALGAGPSGNTKDVFVLSAGANRQTDTRYDVDGVTTQSDDIIYVISGGTR